MHMERMDNDKERGRRHTEALKWRGNSKWEQIKKLGTV